MKRHAKSRLCGRECGYTLLELTVASTLVSIFAIVISSASTMFFGLMDDLRIRTENFRNANVIRARFIGDARQASTSACSDTNSVMFTAEGGAQIEYTAASGNLLRWQSVHDRHVILSDRVTTLTCQDLGEDGLELAMDLGDEDHIFHVYFHVAQADEDGEEGGEE